MHTTVVFSGMGALDSLEVRSHLIRIPEVYNSIRKAQVVWDELGQKSFDLATFICSEDRVFLGNIKLKSLAAAIIQVGLYGRYVKYNGRPGFLLGQGNGDAAVRVAAGQMSLEEMVKCSQALGVTRPSAPLQLADETMLTGIALTEFISFVKTEAEGGKLIYSELHCEEIDVHKPIVDLVDDHGVRSFVNIGPDDVLVARYEAAMVHTDVAVLDSIELDPMLNWFWLELRAFAAAG